MPIIRRKLLYLCDTGICHSVWVASATPPVQSDKYQCRIDTVIFSWWWAHGCPKYVEKRNKYIKQNCAPSWTYLQDYTGMHSQQNIKNLFGWISCSYLLLKLSSNYLIPEGRCALSWERRVKRIFNSCKVQVKVKVKVNAKMKLSLFMPWRCTGV